MVQTITCCRKITIKDFPLLKLYLPAGTFFTHATCDTLAEYYAIQIFTQKKNCQHKNEHSSGDATVDTRARLATLIGANVYPEQKYTFILGKGIPPKRNF